MPADRLPFSLRIRDLIPEGADHRSVALALRLGLDGMRARDVASLFTLLDRTSNFVRGLPSGDRSVLRLDRGAPAGSLRLTSPIDDAEGVLCLIAIAALLRLGKGRRSLAAELATQERPRRSQDAQRPGVAAALRTRTGAAQDALPLFDDAQDPLEDAARGEAKRAFKELGLELPPEALRETGDLIRDLARYSAHLLTALQREGTRHLLSISLALQGGGETGHS